MRLNVAASVGVSHCEMQLTQGKVLKALPWK